MKVPSSELPDTKKILSWARENLPEPYELMDVRCDYGNDGLPMPKDFEVVIEYLDKDPDLAGSLEGIDQYQNWSEPLIEKIRKEWPTDTLRIVFTSRV